jgi:hypothetical protein
VTQNRLPSTQQADELSKLDVVRISKAWMQRLHHLHSEETVSADFTEIQFEITCKILNYQSIKNNFVCH